MSPIVTKSAYTAADLDGAKALCLYVATRLEDLAKEVVVVGGLVPSLLVGVPDPATRVAAHLGTKDVDLGLALRLMDGKRYTEIANRLRKAGFVRDKNDAGNPTNQRWILEGMPGLKLDFLLPPLRPDQEGGTIQNLEADFAAYVVPGLDLAFDDRREVLLSGTTPLHETATRSIYVCEAGAYSILKALALRRRGDEKDAYDLDWILQGYPGGSDAVAGRVRELRDCAAKRDALAYLTEDFSTIDSVGPVRAARFMEREADEGVRTDMHSRVQRLLTSVRGT